MRIINPTFGYPEPERAPAGLATIDWVNDPIVLFSNSKPNATELLEAMGIRLKELVGLKRPDVVHKGNAAAPAPAETIDLIAKSQRVAVLALAD